MIILEINLGVRSVGNELTKYINFSHEERLKQFLNTLSVTNRTPDYYVNWEKVDRETKKYELELNTLNYLIGKDDIYIEALDLFTKQPNLLKAIPSLIASRDKVLDVLTIDENDNMSFEQLDFKTIDTSRIDDYMKFIEQSGLLNFLQQHANRSLVDYVYGVETGLDSNARKKPKWDNHGGNFRETRSKNFSGTKIGLESSSYSSIY